MAERTNVGAHKALRLVPLALAAMLMSAECRADWRFAPQMDLRETYSDNINNQADNIARGSWVSEATPSFTLTENGPRLRLSARGEWHVYEYGQSDIQGVQHNFLRYRADAQANLIQDLLYLDAYADQSRQAISAFGPTTTNQFSSLNNTTVKSWRISPYLRHRFGNLANLEVRYSRDSVKGGVSGFGDSMATTRNANLVSGATSSDVSWNLAYSHQDLNDQYGGRSSSETDLAGLQWNVVRRFALTASVGYDKYHFATLNERTDGRSWAAGFIWQPSTRTSVKATFGHRYFGKTGSLAASHRAQHTLWTLDYTDAVTTTRSQLLLPASVDTAATLDRLLAASYPDPVERQQAVQAYLAATGLPPTLATSINYLSNRYLRDKRLQSAVTLHGSRSDLIMTVYRDERTALSLANSDTQLLNNQFTLNDNVRQRGANVAFDYRLSSRTTATTGVGVIRAQALTSDQSNTNREFHVAMSHSFDRKTRGSIEFRHISGRLDLLGSDSYHENAITATFSVLY